MADPKVRVQKPEVLESRLDALEAPTPDIELYLDSGNGYGSSNTKIRRFSQIRRNTASQHISYSDSPTLGMQVQILKSGLYSVFYADSGGAQSTVGISVNVVAPMTTNISALTYANGLRAESGRESGNVGGVSTVLYLNAGDYVYAHSTGIHTEVGANCLFNIRFIR